ncbi:MAG: hypothetical protein ACLTTW_07185 [Coprobacter sp.]
MAFQNNYQPINILLQQESVLLKCLTGFIRYRPLFAAISISGSGRVGFIPNVSIDADLM